MTTNPPEANIEPRRLRCFVIGPIGNKHADQGSDDRITYEEALEVWEEIILAACQSVGIDPVRADGLTRAGELTEQIFRRLRDDDIVIADLTGANPNVMYELGMRHSRDALTIQIGEFGRLPFDVSTIRTVLFSRSPRGLINGRDELVQILQTGLSGEYDVVTATRIWNENSISADSYPAELIRQNEIEKIDNPDPEDEPGVLDLLADGEGQYQALADLTAAVVADIDALGSTADDATEQMRQSDARGAGMKGRLVVTAKYADTLSEIADRLESNVLAYEHSLAIVSGANFALITQLELDPENQDEEAVADFTGSIRTLARAAREGIGSLSGLVQSMQENAKLARVLRAPTRKATSALERFAHATEQVDEWDRRIQALGF